MLLPWSGIDSIGLTKETCGRLCVVWVSLQDLTRTAIIMAGGANLEEPITFSNSKALGDIP